MTELRAIAIVQARMGSSRLPDKALADLGGRPAIWHLFRQLSGCKELSAVVLATTELARDDPLAAFAVEQGWALFRGQETDVLARYHDAALQFGAEPDTAVVRITGDDLWPDPRLVDALVLLHRSLHGVVHAVCTERSDSFPYGTGVELVSFWALRCAHAEATEEADREHVTRFIFRQPDRFARIELCPSRKLEGASLSIDFEADLMRNRRLLKLLEDDSGARPPYALRSVLEASRALAGSGD